MACDHGKVSCAGREVCAFLAASCSRRGSCNWCVGAASAGEEAGAVSSRGIVLWDGMVVPHSSAACRESRAELSAGHGERGALGWQEGAAAAWTWQVFRRPGGGLEAVTSVLKGEKR